MQICMTKFCGAMSETTEHRSLADETGTMSEALFAEELSSHAMLTLRRPVRNKDHVSMLNRQRSKIRDAKRVITSSRNTFERRRSS
jgi:hypothetical protein